MTAVMGFSLIRTSEKLGQFLSDFLGVDDAIKIIYSAALFQD